MRQRELRITKAMCSKDLCTAAVAYINAGFRVVLLHGTRRRRRCTCGNSQCNSPGKHPISEFFPEGTKSATRDGKLVERAIKKYPNANIAVTLWAQTVVDIDGKSGEQVFEALGLPPTAKVKTSRGSHHYFNKSLQNGSFKLDQLDVLTGKTRMTVVPPSRHVSGHRYAWDCPPGTLASRDVSPIEALRPSARRGDTEKEQRKKITHGAAGGPKIPEGKRNDTLFRVARMLRHYVDQDDAISSAIHALNKDACDEPLSDAEIDSLLRSSGRYSEPPDEMFGPPAHRQSLPVEWLWYPYLPKFGVTILAGDPGRGKSMLIALLVAIVTTGELWPLSGERCKRGRVLLLSAEDSFSRVTLKRLEKTSFDINYLDIMHSPRALTPERLETLIEYVFEKKPALIVIDTLSFFMGGGRDMHRQNEVGEFLGRLNEVAEATGACILGLGHLNKQTNDNPLFRIVGSIGFVATVRSAIFLGVDPADPDRLALGHGKASASALGPTIAFERYGGGREDVPKLMAVGEIDADYIEICAPQKRDPGRPSMQSEAARAHIMKELGNEPKPWSQIWQSGDNRNIASEATFNAVRAEMAKDGFIVQVGKGPKAKWKRANETK
ncbi:AAA family ATPase [Ruegeria sp. ANG10]|uniref:AAA family ATPase n=1 Tax=Ruegeria sp. ANG10 TaxID=3042467 RepID=UPI00345619C5